MRRTLLIFALSLAAVLTGVLIGAGEAWPADQSRLFGALSDGFEIFSQPR